jgi:hypothetical protein
MPEALAVWQSGELLPEALCPSSPCAQQTANPVHSKQQPCMNINLLDI